MLARGSLAIPFELLRNASGSRVHMENASKRKKVAFSQFGRVLGSKLAGVSEFMIPIDLCITMVCPDS